MADSIVCVVLKSLIIPEWFQVIVTTISVLVTIMLAHRVQKEVANTYSKQKQVEAMCNLVEYLNNAKIELVFRESSETLNVGEMPGLYFNIFEIGYLNYSDDVGENQSNYDRCRVYLSDKSKYILDINLIKYIKIYKNILFLFY